MNDRFTRWTAGPRGAEPAVLDEKTNLLWQGSPAPECMEWQEAMRYADSLAWGQLARHASLWRLPTVQELVSIVDYDKCDPSIDQEVFPQTFSKWFWSSSSCVADPTLAWIVNFDYGFVDINGKGDGRHVRCVRAWLID